MTPIRLLVADDHALFREGLQALLAAIPGIEIVGQATNGEEAVALAREVQPDVALIDINMPGLNGIEATRQILRTHPDVGIIMVTMLEDDASLFAAMRAGARGYVLKGAHYQELLNAIRAVARGEALFGPAIAAKLTNFFARSRPAAPEAFPELTEREGEVLALIAQGYDNAAIARRLMISPKTVRNHVSNIFGKLQVADRAEAILRAREAGLGDEKEG